MAEPDLRDHLDLVGLATVCDVVPLIGVNRAFVRQGLGQLSKLSRPGPGGAGGGRQGARRLSPPYHLGFVFGPRINAGGRVGRSILGADLLTARDAEAAAEFATQLDLHNQERQAIEKLILEEAIALAATQDNAPFLLVAGEGWHPGVVGIVAGRLKERFAKPAFVAGFEGGMGRGSARSIPGIDIGAHDPRRARGRADRIRRRPCHGGGLLADGGQLDGFPRISASSSFPGAGAALEAAATLDLDAVSSPAGANLGAGARDRRWRALRRRQSRTAAGLSRMCGWPLPIWWAARM